MRSLALILLLALPAHAQTDAERLATIEAERDAAQARSDALAVERKSVLAELSDLKIQLTQMGRDTRGVETQVAEIEGEIETIAAREAALAGRIGDDRVAIRRLLTTLTAIERDPPPAIGISPDDAIAAARAGKISASVSKNLAARAAELAGRIEVLGQTRDALNAKRTALDASRGDLDVRRAAVAELVARKSDLNARLQAEARAQAQRVAELTAEAETLAELLAKLEREAKLQAEPPRRLPDADRPARARDIVPRIKPPVGSAVLAARPLPEGLRFADARGQLGLPVEGEITRRFGQTVSGEREKGLTVRTAGRAQVSTPYTSRVEFAGPFKNYDRMVILNAGDGYFVVMTGLSETFVQPGETVAPGEPVGRMPGGSSDLYLEFRKDGMPVNPAGWLADGVG